MVALDEAQHLRSGGAVIAAMPFRGHTGFAFLDLKKAHDTAYAIANALHLSAELLRLPLHEGQVVQVGCRTRARLEGRHGLVRDLNPGHENGFASVLVEALDERADLPPSVELALRADEGSEERRLDRLEAA